MLAHLLTLIQKPLQIDIHLTCLCWVTYGQLWFICIFAGEVKHHYVLKRYCYLDTGFKQTGPSPFSPCYSNGINSWTTFKYKLEKLCQNCQQILKILNNKTLTRTNIQTLSWILILQSHNTATNVDDMLLNCHIFTIGKTHTEDERNIRFML